MFGGGIIGALLLVVVPYLPTSDGLYCYLCATPQALGVQCKSVGVCSTKCVYFVAGDPHRQDWTCLELVPEHWKGVTLNNRWTSDAENFIISHEYYPNENSHDRNYVVSAFGCDNYDYCNNMLDYAPAPGHNRGSPSPYLNKKSSSSALGPKLGSCLSFVFSLVPFFVIGNL